MHYALVVLSLLLAASQYLFGAAPFGDSEAGDVFASLTYAFAPLVLALALAGSKHLVQRARAKPTSFAFDLLWMWGLLLTIVIFAHVVAMVQS
jgi:hypothetical protein